MNSQKSWAKIAGWLVIVGIATVVVNWAAKRACDLWKTGI